MNKTALAVLVVLGSGLSVLAAQDAPLDPFMHQRLHRLLLPFQRGLADAGQSRIGAQPEKEIIPQSCVGEKGFDLRDFHAAY